MYIWIAQLTLSLLIATTVFLRGIWPFEALAGALTQLALVSLFFAFLSFFLGRPLGAILLVAAATLAFWRAGAAFEAATPKILDPQAKIIWANLFARQSSLNAVQTLALKENADLVAFGEFPLNATLLSAFQEKYPHQFPQKPTRSQDNVIFSRSPFNFVQEIPARRRSNLMARTIIAGGPFTLVVSHAPVPWAPKKLISQRQIITEAFGAVRSQSSYLIIGDFNAAPWNLTLVQAMEHPTAPERLSLGARSTWLSPFPLLGTAIDHAFVSPDMAGSVAFGSANGSDHFPIIVSLKRKPPSSTRLIE